MLQATYLKTGLTPNEGAEKALKSEKFEVRWRSDDSVHVMLYPKQFSDVKVQILRSSANVWCQDINRLYEVEELLNRTFRDKDMRKPFKQPKIQLLLGEQRRILETPLGLLSILVYYYRDEIADALDRILQNISKWDQWQKPRNT